LERDAMMRQQSRFGDPMASALSKSKVVAGASTLTDRYNAEAMNNSGEVARGVGVNRACQVRRVKGWIVGPLGCVLAAHACRVQRPPIYGEHMRAGNWVGGCAAGVSKAGLSGILVSACPARNFPSKWAWKWLLQARGQVRRSVWAKRRIGRSNVSSSPQVVNPLEPWYHRCACCCVHVLAHKPRLGLWRVL